MSQNDEYDVGYGKPPKASRWRKGQSGNRHGRRKGVRNLKTDLTKLLKKRVTVREDGEVRHLSRQEAMLLSLFSKAVHGDVKATNSILAMCMKFDPPDEMRDKPKKISESDEAIIEDFLRRRAAETEGSDHE